MSRRPNATSRRSNRPSTAPTKGRGEPRTARTVALDALVRIETEGAYANLVLGQMLTESGLDGRDRGMVTEMVYGTTRMRRSCDWLIDRFVLNELEPRVRSALRLGAYQLTYMRVPAHAAVSATVDLVPGRARGLVNAVLRRVAAHPVDEAAPPESGGWPDVATRLSYPDWIVDRLTTELGPARAVAALEAMNRPAAVHEREDGYVQDLASQAVVRSVEVEPGALVVDMCAAPGGKATALAERGARVIAADVRPARAGLISANVARLDLEGQVSVVAADGRHLPFGVGTVDVVLVDAPCSGLGSLRRRPDARWRIAESDVDRLVVLQRELVDAALGLIRPGGQLVYSVCTMLDDETLGLDGYLARHHPELEPVFPGEQWEPLGRGGRLLPSDDGSDGMACFRYRVPTEVRL